MFNSAKIDIVKDHDDSLLRHNSSCVVCVKTMMIDCRKVVNLFSPYSTHVCFSL